MDSSTHQSSFTLPDTLPLIVLEECYLFPGCFLPLYIFEQRYRLMLEYALKTNRMFGVGICSGGHLLPVTTAGLIRASKKQPDGTSHVMLYGVTRVRLTGWEQVEPFRVAKIEPVKTTTALSVKELVVLRERALDLLPPTTPETSEAMQTLRCTLGQMPCTELACDVLSYHFVREPKSMRALLVEPCLEKRYALLHAELSCQSGAA